MGAQKASQGSGKRLNGWTKGASVAEHDGKSQGGYTSHDAGTAQSSASAGTRRQVGGY